MARLEIFISVGPDLEPEREAVARAVLGLPISLGWVVKFTPRPGKALGSALELVRSCHFYVFLLGQDISAPTGVEWDVAARNGKRPLAYRKEVFRTPAARVFQAMAGANWRKFRTPWELASLLQKALAERLRDGAEWYGVTPAEWSELEVFLEGLEEREEALQAGEEQGQKGLGDMGEGGVVVSPDRDLPPGGVLVGEF